MNHSVDFLKPVEKNTLNPTYGRRQSWHLTSKEVGHHYRPGYYFPESEFESIIRAPLPPKLAGPKQVTRAKSHPTTTGFFHDHKHKAGVYDSPLHPKAPGLRKVNYVKDMAEKLGSGGWRKPLTMGYQTTEYSEYGQHPVVKPHRQFDEVFKHQPYLLHDHHNDGPTKIGEAKSHNPKLTGEPWYVRDKGVLRELDPYLSTTQKDHRRWGDNELRGYPKKDPLTYWEGEEYPKAWGHGSHHNPLPKDSVPRDKLPMRDTLIFKDPTHIGRLNKAAVHVPHAGLKTQYSDMYQSPSHVNMKMNYFCPVDTPYIQPDTSTKSIFTVPGMYKTEYMNIGSNRPVTVACGV